VTVNHHNKFLRHTTSNLYDDCEYEFFWIIGIPALGEVISGLGSGSDTPWPLHLRESSSVFVIFLTFSLALTFLLMVINHLSSRCQTLHLSMVGLSQNKNFTRQYMASRVSNGLTLNIYLVLSNKLSRKNGWRRATAKVIISEFSKATYKTHKPTFTVPTYLLPLALVKTTS